MARSDTCVNIPIMRLRQKRHEYKNNGRNELLL